MQEFERPPLIPTRPNIRVSGLIPHMCSVFQSAMKPLLLAFKIDKSENESRPSVSISVDKIAEKHQQQKKRDVNESVIADAFESLERTPPISHLSSPTVAPTSANVKISDTDIINVPRSQLINVEVDDCYKIIWKNGDDLRCVLCFVLLLFLYFCLRLRLIFLVKIN